MSMINATRPFAGPTVSLFSRTANAARSVVALIKARRDLKQFRELDDHMLNDIGLSRSDLYAPGWAPSQIDPMVLMIKVSRAP